MYTPAYPGARDARLDPTLNTPSSAGNAVSYEYSDDTGDAQRTVYPVFPGIDLSYHAVHREYLHFPSPGKGPVIEIHHCRQGRLEQEWGEDFFYLMPGDLSIAIRDSYSHAYHFPLQHYHGITITVDAEHAPRCFSCFLQDVTVQPMAVAEKLCGESRLHIIRAQDYVEHIFSELYAVPESIRQGYLKIKVLELFLILSGLSPQQEPQEPPALSRLQVRTAKLAADHLHRNLDRHVTIAELAARFHISQTHLKQAFKGVYGMPIFSYIRFAKMQSAANSLITTEDPVLTIANRCGYDNASKFARAFREVMGETPTEYRRGHKPV